MADQLCAPEDLASLLERDLDAYKAIMLVECGTAVVQEAAGQRIVRVTDDTEGEQMGTTDAWLILPERPVVSVFDVAVDGGVLVEGTDYKRIGNRLWAADGWAVTWTEPSIVTYIYTHGYLAGHQKLQLGRNSVLSLIRSVFDNPTGTQREAIDDYSATYEAMTQQMQAWPGLRRSLLRQYGPGAGIVRFG